ncbi:MAG: tetratricopeptide repeat protein [bacterium]|nr:tetratricopeptide repeat protein [bacterium]
MRKCYRLIFIQLCLLTIPSFAFVSSAGKKFDKVLNQKKDLTNRLLQTQGKLDELNQELVVNQKKIISKIFSKTIDEIVSSEKNENGKELVEMLQRFIQRNPNGGDLTAHALVVLAEQFFVSEESLFLADIDHETKASVPNFSKSIKIYEQVIKSYPKYMFIDVAYYMLGICYSYEEKQNLAIKTWQLLVNNFPKSSFAEEVWFRLGEEIQ